MLDACPPSGDFSGPRISRVFDADILLENLAAPAIVVSRHPENGNSRVGQFGERGKNPKASTRNHRRPLEPEVEEIAVDRERRRAAAQRSKKHRQILFDLGRCDADMRVGDQIARRFEHAGIVACTTGKRTTDSSDILLGVETPANPVETILEFRVRYGETDQMRVVYHANYLVWCEMGRTDLIRALGVSYAEMERSGVALAVVDATLRYHYPARYDDMIRVRTTLTEVRSRSVTFDYRIENADTGLRLVTATTTLIPINEEGKLVSLPVELRRRMELARS